MSKRSPYSTRPDEFWRQNFAKALIFEAENVRSDAIPKLVKMLLAFI